MELEKLQAVKDKSSKRLAAIDSLLTTKNHWQQGFFEDGIRVTAGTKTDMGIGYKQLHHYALFWKQRACSSKDPISAAASYSPPSC
ncbi:MAG: hypothetical protein ACHP65_02735 [Legionellales bacterium]